MICHSSTVMGELKVAAAIDCKSDVQVFIQCMMARVVYLNA